MLKANAVRLLPLHGDGGWKTPQMALEMLGKHLGEARGVGECENEMCRLDLGGWGLAFT